MDNTAENMDFMEAGDGQLAKLQAGEIDTATVIQINELRQDIVGQLARAEEEGVISKRDVKKWSNILKDSGNSKQEVATIQNQVLAVIEESKRLIGELPAGEKEVAIFKQMSIREKREYLTNLRKASDDLKGRADKLEDLFPDAVEKLQILRGADRAKYIEELNLIRTNVAKYGNMIGEHAKYFSKKSQGEFMRMFKELSVDEQDRWLKEFKAKEADPRIKLSGRYESLPSQYRERIADFYEMPRHDKEKAVNKAEEEKAFADKLYGSGEYKYMSSESRKFMKKTFIAADPHLRKAMMGMIDKAIKEEAALGRKFEALPEKVRKKHPDFMEKGFEEKKEIIDRIPDALTQEYDAKLQVELKEKVIGLQTYEDYLDWFKKEDLQGRLRAGDDVVFTAQMKERKELKARFENKEELPEEVRKANSHFYNLGLTARKELFERLKKEHAEKAKGAEVAGANAGVEKKPAVAEKKAVLEGSGAVKDSTTGVEDKDSDFEEADIEDAIKSVKEESSLMKKRIRDHAIAEGVVSLAEKSDLTNQGVYDSARKDQHLQDSKERKLNDELVRFSGGKAVAESGHKKAKMVKDIDLNKISEGVVTEDALLDLKKEVINNQGEKARDVFHLQLNDLKSGLKLSGSMGRQKTAENKKVLQDEIADKVAAKMGLTGENLNRERKEKLRRVARKDKLKVDLREAA